MDKQISEIDFPVTCITHRFRIGDKVGVKATNTAVTILEFTATVTKDSITPNIFYKTQHSCRCGESLEIAFYSQNQLFVNEGELLT